MQNSPSQENASGVSQKVESKRQRPRIDLRSSDLPGGLALVTVIVIGIIVYVAHYQVTEHSASIKFGTEAIFSFLALVVVGAQAIIYYQQAKFMEQSLGFSILAEQACVRVAKWHKPSRENGKLIISNRFHNGGKTPAWNVQPSCPSVSVGIDLENAQPLMPTYLSFDPYNVGMIVAGDSLPFSVSFEASDELIKAVEVGTVAVFVDGSCSYYDSFGGQKFYIYKVTLQLNPSRVAIRYDWQHRIDANKEN